MKTTITGSCLCQQASYHSNAEPVFAAHCHCDDCRKNTGSGYAALVFVPTESLICKGETKSYTHSADSGNTMTKHFCPHCGSQLYGTNSRRPELTHIKVGSLDDASWFTPRCNVYASRRLNSTPINAKVPDAETMPQPKKR